MGKGASKDANSSQSFMILSDLRYNAVYVISFSYERCPGVHSQLDNATASSFLHTAQRLCYCSPVETHLYHVVAW